MNDRLYQRAVKASGSIIIKGPITGGNFHVEITVPKQLCIECHQLFDAYLVDDYLWNKLPKELRDAFLCHKCFKRHLSEKRGDGK
jgi:hypothetical protein